MQNSPRSAGPLWGHKRRANFPFAQRRTLHAHRPPTTSDLPHRPTRTRPAATRAPGRAHGADTRAGELRNVLGRRAAHAGHAGSAPIWLQQHIRNPLHIAQKRRHCTKVATTDSEPRVHTSVVCSERGSIGEHTNLSGEVPDSYGHHNGRTARAAPALSSTMCRCSSMPKKSRRWRGTARQASDAYPILQPGEHRRLTAAAGSKEERSSANTTAAWKTRDVEKGEGEGAFARPTDRLCKKTRPLERIQHTHTRPLRRTH